MAYVVLVAWLIQSTAGVVLVVTRLRAGRDGIGAVAAHVALGLSALACWVVFLAQGSLVAAWLAFGIVNVGNTIGDGMLLRRWRRMNGTTGSFWGDYRGTLGSIFRGEFPRAVTFHACFSGVVYFSCLGVCIGATVAT